MTGESKARVVVIGAGLSGLTAAHRLVAGGLESVVVLEADSRLGGRAVSTSVGPAGIVVDEGATFVYPVQHDAVALAAELGVRTFGAGADGAFLYHSGGRSHRFDFGNLRGFRLLSSPALRPLWRRVLSVAVWWLRLPMSAEAMLELFGVLRRLDELVATVPPDAPWNAPGAAELDRTPLASWLDGELRTWQARRLFQAFFGFFAPTTSLLHVSQVLRTWGGVGQLLTGRADVYRFHGGTQALADALGTSLGERVRLDTPVRAIEQRADEVTVRAACGDVTADRVIVTVPPSGCRGIAFIPELPAARRLLQDAWREVHGLKINAIYEEPFWRAAGLSGSALADLDFIQDTFDASPADLSAGVLASYVTVPEDQSEVFSGDPALRRAKTLSDYVQLFGPKAADPVAYVEKNWRDENYAFGCEGGLATGALTTARTRLRDPVGRVHWAGTDTADRWAGYLNGAIQAGERAAREILAR